jgi:hypothetical protein
VPTQSTWTSQLAKGSASSHKTMATNRDTAQKAVVTKSTTHANNVASVSPHSSFRSTSEHSCQNAIPVGQPLSVRRAVQIGVEN